MEVQNAHEKGNGHKKEKGLNIKIKEMGKTD